MGALTDIANRTLSTQLFSNRWMQSRVLACLPFNDQLRLAIFNELARVTLASKLAGVLLFHFKFILYWRI
jgi:hypothetical protein